MTSATHGDGTLVAPAGASLVADAVLPGDARVAVVASRYHSEVIQKLLEGALEAVEQAGIDASRVDILPAAGAFELGLLARAAAQSGRYVAVSALGCVIRGDTPHFDYVCSEASRAMTLAALETGVPVGFGLITCDTPEQAWERAGGAAGNKGAEATAAALASARTLAGLDAVG
ncbi:MAG: 6,7-dimethyl-8-ribityllumazine synthase [Gaiellales bacterium]